MFEVPSVVGSTTPLPHRPLPLTPSRPFSPESVSGLLERERSYHSYIQRFQSEVRIISHFPDLLSPTDGSPLLLLRSDPSHAPPAEHPTFPTQYPATTQDTAAGVSVRSESGQGSHCMRSRTTDVEFSPTRYCSIFLCSNLQQGLGEG